MTGMVAANTAPEDIDAYISSFPASVREVLQKIRVAIKNAAPHAEEAISYRMPTFKLKGSLVYFAAYKKHIGFYPTAAAVKRFKRELSVFDGAKGSVRFPLDKPIPFGLISDIVKFRVKQNLKKAAIKKQKL
jgi:uncharacterized protein YdhG (YjbR/CyaY superfamily)